jgi:very-short-patch-repair endonuclease
LIAAGGRTFAAPLRISRRSRLICAALGSDSVSTIRNMFTGVLRYRSRGSRSRARERSPPAEVLRRLLGARSLRSYQFASRCEIGPFVVDFLCAEHAVVVELEGLRRNVDTRARFLESLGYRVVTLSSRELFHRPEVALARIRRALHAG